MKITIPVTHDTSNTYPKEDTLSFVGNHASDAVVIQLVDPERSIQVSKKDLKKVIDVLT